jgi:hypothetical protein
MCDAQETVVGSSGNVLYYHIITFAMFHVTSVDPGGQAVPEAGVTLVQGKCPVERSLQKANPQVLPNSAKTIEGYFLQGVPPGINGKPGDGVDGGAHTLYLTQ